MNGLEIEPGAQVVHGSCDHCGGATTRLTAFVHRDDHAYAVYYASCSHHEGREDEALAHPRLGEFWELVDHVLTHDRVVSAHIYGPDASFDGT